MAQIQFQNPVKHLCKMSLAIRTDTFTDNVIQTGLFENDCRIPLNDGVYWYSFISPTFHRYCDINNYYVKFPVGKVNFMIVQDGRIVEFNSLDDAIYALALHYHYTDHSNMQRYIEYFYKYCMTHGNYKAYVNYIIYMQQREDNGEELEFNKEACEIAAFEIGGVDVYRMLVHHYQYIAHNHEKTIEYYNKLIDCDQNARSDLNNYLEGI